MSASTRHEVEQHIHQCAVCKSKVDKMRSAGQWDARNSETTPFDCSNQNTSDPHDLSSVGSLPLIEGYELLSRIHSGAQGIVYKAVQKSTSRTVAVKLLPHEHNATDRQKHRFEREVGLAASLRHPNIVTVYDSGLTSGRYFFAMEYIHGKPLNDYVSTAKPNVSETLRSFATICSAVSYAHQKGVIHRDLKPGNILVDSSGQPHVVDFGLAKSAGVIAMHGDAPFTLTSQFMGTLAYASPEQTKGDPALIDMRSDIYSLGVILFEMLTGTYPYPSSTDLVKMFQTICHTPPKPPSSLQPEVDGDVDTIVLRTLAKEPERRYQSVKDLQEDVERWLAGEPIAARRDSLPYLVRIRGRRWLERHRLVASIGAITLVTLAMLLFWLPVHRLWPLPFDAYEQLLATRFAPATTGVPYEQVCVIAITDETQQRINEIAQDEALEGVVANNWRSVRRLHGRLMERLAAMGPSALVWDIVFPQPESVEERSSVAPFNQSFADGIKAMHGVGVTPVVAIRGWDGSTSPTAGISPEILGAGVELGGGVYRFPETAPWRVALVIKRGESTLLPGLALKAAVHARTPNRHMVMNLDESAETLNLSMTQQADSRQASINPTVATIWIPVSYVAPFVPDSRDEADVDLRPGDIIAWMVIQLPSDDEINRITIPYHDLFTSDERSQAELAARVKGKLVVIGDLRSIASGDVKRAPDGRNLSGLYAHVAAMDALQRSAVIMRFPNNATYISILAIGGLLGVGMARILPGDWKVRLLALTIGVFVLFVLSVHVYRGSGFMCNPLLPASTMLLGCVVATAFLNVNRVRVSQLSSSSGGPLRD